MTRVKNDEHAVAREHSTCAIFTTSTLWPVLIGLLCFGLLGTDELIRTSLRLTGWAGTLVAGNGHNGGAIKGLVAKFNAGADYFFLITALHYSASYVAYE